MRDAPCRREESALDVLGVEAHLDRVAARRGLAEREPVAHRDAQLLLDEVDVPDELRHRMLHLEARVHFEEGEVALRVDDELGRPGVRVLRLARDRDRGLRERLALSIFERRRGRLLEDLLVPALRRAVALAEREDLAVRVGKDLHLDMPRPLDELLEHEPLVVERRGHDAPRLRQRVPQGGRLAHALHPDAAAARDRLHHHRVADPRRGGDERFVALVRVHVAGQHRHARALRERLRLRLVAERCQHLGVRADEAHPRGDDGPREGWRLREEAVPGMNEIRFGLARRGDHALDVEIRLGRGWRTDAQRDIGLARERLVLIRVGIHRDGPHVHAPRRAKDAARDLPAVRDQERRHHFGLRRSRNDRMPSWPSSLTRMPAMRSTVFSRTSATGRPATSRTRRFAAFTACGPPAMIASR